jgi:hypothetical protein
MTDRDKQDERIQAIVGDDDQITFEDGVERFYEHLKAKLKLPCDVTGTEDFRWEERYVFGPGDRNEYARLKKSRPSYRDVYELLAIERHGVSEWMMFSGDDLAAHVRRKSDSKEFMLGLAELKAVDQKSANCQLLNDFAVYLVNYR